jgi:plasmid maintenance system antidote protein VapI
LRKERSIFWLCIQAQFDLETAQDSLDEDIAAIKPRKIA